MTPFVIPNSAAVPSHHPCIETLAEFAAGQMRAGFDLVVASHLRGCRFCRDEVAQFEALGGGLLDSIEPFGLDDGALAAAMARIDEPETAEAAPSPRSLDTLLAAARRRWVAPGIWVATIDTPHDPDDRIFLLSVNAGRGTAPHCHTGAEMTQVLKGALTDDGIIYRAGDMVELDQAHTHHPKVSGDEPCVCLFATQGRLKSKTLIGKIAFALAGV